MKYIMGILLLNLVSLGHSSTLESNSWINLLTTVQTQGELQEFSGSYGSETYISLSSVVPSDPNSPRSANYISLVGQGSRDQFEAQYVSLVCENWTLVNKHHQKVWRVDNWEFKYSLDQVLTESRHDTTFFSLTHRFLDEDTIRYSRDTITNSKVQHKARYWINFWINHTK